MKALLDTIEEAFRAGYNAACWTPDSGEPEKKEVAWSTYKCRPAIQSMLDKVALSHRLLKCTEHGEAEPVLACKPCLDKMQRFILLAKERAEAEHATHVAAAKRILPLEAQVVGGALPPDAPLVGRETRLRGHMGTGAPSAPSGVILSGEGGAL
jgi:hypothetical protein